MDATNQKDLVDQFSPIFVEYKLMREFLLLQQKNISNVYIVPSDSSPSKWFGVMFIDSGLYFGAIFRFTLLIPSNYQNGDKGNYPRLIFDNVPFHPLINPKTGELCLKKAFPLWKSNVNQLWEIINYAKKIFDCIETEMDYPIDPKSKDLSEIFYIENVRFFKSDFEIFRSKVAETVEMSKIKIYDPPKDCEDVNAIIFGDYNPEIHQKARNELLHLKSSSDDEINDQLVTTQHPSYFGLSWIQNESLFSKSAF